jgi:hypothetical protein
MVYMVWHAEMQYLTFMKRIIVLLGVLFNLKVKLA